MHSIRLLNFIKFPAHGMAGLFLLLAMTGPDPALVAQPTENAEAKASLVIQGKLINGTNNSPTRVDSLTLISLGGQGMQTLQTLTNAGPAFKFKPIAQPRGPLLIRATFQGINHSHMIPPVADRQQAQQIVQVFEGGAKPADIGIYQGLKISKRKDSLFINHVFLVRNSSQPPRNFALDDYINLQLPAGARQVRAQLKYRSTGMPITLSLQPGSKPGTLRLNRNLRPEPAEISVDYEVPGHTVTTGPAVILKPELSQQAGWSNRMVLLWSPRESKPEISGVPTSTPEGMSEEAQHGDMIQMEFTPGKSATLNFKRGPFIYNSLLEGASNPIFNNGWVTMLGLIFVFCLSLAIIAAARLSGLQLIRRK